MRKIGKVFKIINKNLDDENYLKQREYTKQSIVKIKIFDTQSSTIQNKIINIISKYNLEKYKKPIKAILIFIGFGLSYWFYYLSLESCFDGEGPCATYVDWMKLKVIEEIISCILFTIMIQVIFLKVISKIYLIQIILVFILFYYYRHGMDFVDHGYFNFFFFLL